jgi:hypothetical protein
MTGAAREWMTAHLPWIVIALLALWVPPVIYDVAVFDAWRDPVTLAAIVEVGLMCAALPGLFARRLAGWRLLVASRFVVFAQTSWLLLLNTRLNGLVPTLSTKPIIEAALGLAIAAWMLMPVRGLYR